MDSSSELNSLLNGGTGSSSSLSPTFALPAGLMTLITVFGIITSVATLIVLVLYFINAMTTYRAHKANIEIRDILREINERDKARSLAVPQPPTPQSVAVSTEAPTSPDTSANS